MIERRSVPRPAQAAGADSGAFPSVVVIADVETNAIQLIERVLKPGGIPAWPAKEGAPKADVLVVDVTQIRGDPMSGLRNRREMGDDAPAIVLAAHFPASRLRSFLKMGVRDVLLKPYREEELREAILALGTSSGRAGHTAQLSQSVEALREELRRRTDEVRMLSEIGRVVAGLDNLDQILARLVEAAAYVTDAEEASIYLEDPETNEVVLRATKQAGERHATLQRLRADDMLVGEVFRTGQPILRQPNMEGGPVKVQTGFLVQSVVKVPIRVQKAIVGVLGVYNRMALRSFNQHHVTVLMSLADWAGVALDRATLVQQAGAPTSGTGPISLAPKGLLDGLDQALATLDGLLNGSSAGAGRPVKGELLKLLDQLRSMRRMPITIMDPEVSTQFVDLTRLVHKAAGEHQLVATRRGLGLIVEAETVIPAFEGDRNRVYQVLQALVAAAVRRTPKGRILIQTHALTVANGRSEGILLPEEVKLDDGSWAAVTVADTGPGLSPDTIRAFRDPRADPSAGNLGYGLTLGEIRMIVESMGGVLWYDQTPAATKITFALPAGE
jgi:signal transduction histidine kinase/DNA-binding response OmpR family regulator